MKKILLVLCLISLVIMLDEISTFAAKVDNLKIKGDLRLRYQWEEKESKTDRHRGRFRLRMGVEAEVVENAKVKFGLASGGDDPRSTNQTLQNSFDTPDIRLDYAYAEYAPAKELKFFGGKFNNPFWRPTDLLWD